MLCALLELILLPLAIGGNYPHAIGLFPFIVQCHTYLEDDESGGIIRCRPLPMEYCLLDHLLLSRNSFNLHCMAQMQTVDDELHCGYIYLFRFQVRCGPYVPVPSSLSVLPAFVLETSHYVRRLV